VIPLAHGAGVKGKTVGSHGARGSRRLHFLGVEGMTGVEEILDPLQYRTPSKMGLRPCYHDPSRLTEISRRQRSMCPTLQSRWHPGGVPACAGCARGLRSPGIRRRSNRSRLSGLPDGALEMERSPATRCRRMDS